MCVQVVPVEALRVRLDAQDIQAGSIWQRVPELSDLASGATTVAEVAGVSVLVCRLGAELLAYHDVCVRCGFSLRGAVLLAPSGAASGEFVLRCPGCDAHYDACRGGTLLDDALSHLTPVPVMTERGVPSVMVGLSVGMDSVEMVRGSLTPE